MANGWVYVFGERSGRALKVGYTSRTPIRERLEQVNSEQTDDHKYIMLVAVRGDTKDEQYVLRTFPLLQRGTKREYVAPVPEAVEWANWLRAQFFVAVDPDEVGEDLPSLDAHEWLPTEWRRIPLTPPDTTKMIQDYEFRADQLAGTAWAAMVNPKASFQDYFTPPEIVNAAREAMGDIDLDAASHWAANRVHRIPKYFTAGFSAHDHEWQGRVWLNPPYGDNAPWVRDIVQYVGSGAVTQLCMLSPVWAFTTALARPLWGMCSAFMLLSPTPQFWGNAEGRTGTNNPHGVLYIGNRPAEFKAAFAPLGIPMRLDAE